MNRHPYLRAYMAGIVVPTMFLLVLLGVYVGARVIHNFPTPVERVIAFPMAVVPNLWGLWNIVWVASFRRRISLGAHGAILPLVLGPLGAGLWRLMDVEIPAAFVSIAPLAFPVAVIVYYLAWKYIVGFLNDLLGVG
ncbi:MAG: hypothetical protein ACRD96_20810 [Bryobacteraceae bacterium]